ncbi:uncharacterized protein RJT21DRAFT_121042 [Scheffersomyces amazonensis]|uniref:uncharacterized protein n=1 Tax=Scheffersomyces amazonensis TaxID=1078765 RepID=UPI00315C9E3C
MIIDLTEDEVKNEGNPEDRGEVRGEVEMVERGGAEDRGLPAPPARVHAPAPARVRVRTRVRTPTRSRTRARASTRTPAGVRALTRTPAHIRAPTRTTACVRARTRTRTRTPAHVQRDLIQEFNERLTQGVHIILRDQDLRFSRLEQAIQNMNNNIVEELQKLNHSINRFSDNIIRLLERLPIPAANNQEFSESKMVGPKD